MKTRKMKKHLRTHKRKIRRNRTRKGGMGMLRSMGKTMKNKTMAMGKAVADSSVAKAISATSGTMINRNTVMMSIVNHKSLNLDPTIATLDGVIIHAEDFLLLFKKYKTLLAEEMVDPKKCIENVLKKGSGNQYETSFTALADHYYDVHFKETFLGMRMSSSISYKEDDKYFIRVASKLRNEQHYKMDGETYKIPEPIPLLPPLPPSESNGLSSPPPPKQPESQSESAVLGGTASNNQRAAEKKAAADKAAAEKKAAADKAAAEKAEERKKREEAEAAARKAASKKKAEEAAAKKAAEEAKKEAASKKKSDDKQAAEEAKKRERAQERAADKKAEENFVNIVVTPSKKIKLFKILLKRLMDGFIFGLPYFYRQANEFTEKSNIAFKKNWYTPFPLINVRKRYSFLFTEDTSYANFLTFLAKTTNTSDTVHRKVCLANAMLLIAYLTPTDTVREKLLDLVEAIESKEGAIKDKFDKKFYTFFKDDKDLLKELGYKTEKLDELIEKLKDAPVEEGVSASTDGVSQGEPAGEAATSEKGASEAGHQVTQTNLQRVTEAPTGTPVTVDLNGTSLTVTRQGNGSILLSPKK
jgi:hypothetical protein